jgi:hypothetical protein
MANLCAVGGCTGIAYTGRFCAAHVGTVTRPARPAIDSWYSRAAWCGPYGVRGYKLRRDPLCEIDGCTKPATDVHHTKDWKASASWFIFMGGNDMEFLQSLCHGHHSEITKANQEKSYGTR